MEIHRPFRTITPTIDGDLLRVLGRSASWFTVARLRGLAGSGSPEGVRKVLRRLQEQGIVETQAAGRAFLYRLNREHLAAAAIIQLADLDRELHDRLRRRLEAFRVEPTYALLFGSAARGEMTAASDIDLMLIRARPASEEWDEDVADLAAHVHRWTGNDARIVDYHLDDVLGAAGDEPLLRSVAAEGIALVGSAVRFRKDVGAG